MGGEDPLFPDSYNRPVLKADVIKRLRQIMPLEGYDPKSSLAIPSASAAARASLT